MRMPCEHGRYETHPNISYGADHVEDNCPGGRAPTQAEWVAFGEQQGFIDYEAALKAYLHLAWARDGLGPLADELKLVVINGVKVPILSDFQEASRIVDAALKGET